MPTVDDRAPATPAAGIPGDVPALELVSVGLAYGGLMALSSVDARIERGRITGLIGPNGAGKTSLFDVVTGLTKPTAGRVLLHGRDVTRARPATRARLGLGRTFQRLELFSSLTVAENVAVAAEASARSRFRLRRWGMFDSDAPAAVHSQLERLGLSQFASERVDTLSTGTARLVEVARAMASRPSVLLLDEPASGLGSDETDRLAHVLLGLALDGMAVLLVEHDVELVMRLCTTVIVLDQGSILASGPPEVVRAQADVRDAYLGQMAIT